MLRVKRDIFSPERLRVLPTDINLPSVLTSHSASNSRVSEVSKTVLTFFMMSEEQWTTDENIVFFGKRSIVIKGTSHSTIFDIPMRPLPEDQKHRRRFTR